MDVDAAVSRFGDPVPPLFWFRDLENNTLMVVEVRPPSAGAPRRRARRRPPGDAILKQD